MVSVIMPVYNCENFIINSVESILGQTFTDFEFIIIDDCSTDNTYNLLKQFKDNRIRLLKNENNLGIVKTLNNGLLIAKYNLIVRMDGDDISLPSRIENLYYNFQNNTNLILCGSSYYFLFHNGKKILNKVQFSNERIKNTLIFFNSFCHSSVMYKRNIALSVGGYKVEDYNCEDYGLWKRMSHLGEFSNIKKPLLLYRVHNSNISNKNIYKRKHSEEKLINKTLRIDFHFKQYLNLNNYDLLLNLIKSRSNCNYFFIKRNILKFLYFRHSYIIILKLIIKFKIIDAFICLDILLKHFLFSLKFRLKSYLLT
jgi:glycosyltransferase involved in cell wall biosynthesis